MIRDPARERVHARSLLFGGLALASFLRSPAWRHGRRALNSFGILIAMTLGSMSHVGEAWSAGRAVEVLNYQAGVGYSWEHVEDSTERFAGFGFEIPGEDTHRVGAYATVTVPLVGWIGARASIQPGYSNRRIDDSSDSETEGDGVAVGGDLFVRDPEHFEVGIGPRYDWTSFDTDSQDVEVQSIAGEAYARIFLPDLGSVPADLWLSGSIGDLDIDFDFGDLAGKTRSVAGGIVAYPIPRLAIRTGGGFIHEESSGSSYVESKYGVLGFDLLMMSSPALILAPRVTVGDRDTATAGPISFDQTYYSVGFVLSASFPGADSLVALRRRFQ